VPQCGIGSIGCSQATLGHTEPPQGPGKSNQPQPQSSLKKRPLSKIGPGGHHHAAWSSLDTPSTMTEARKDAPDWPNPARSGDRDPDMGGRATTAEQPRTARKGSPRRTPDPATARNPGHGLNPVLRQNAKVVHGSPLRAKQHSHWHPSHNRPAEPGFLQHPGTSPDEITSETEWVVRLTLNGSRSHEMRTSRAPGAQDRGPVDCCRANGEAMDNLRVLAENGVQAWPGFRGCGWGSGVRRGLALARGSGCSAVGCSSAHVRVPVTHSLLDLASLVHLSRGFGHCRWCVQ